MQKSVCIVAPSGAIDPTLIEGAAERLKKEGFCVTIAPHAQGAYGRFAAKEDERLSDLNHALACSDYDFILAARGGYGLMQIIDRVVVPAGKTPCVIGFSDITALHCLMGHHGKPSIHGVMCKHLSEQPSRDSTDALIRLMKGSSLHYTLPAHPLNRYGQTSGVLRGGNLSLLYGLQATPYACPIQDGDILFLEDVGEHPYAIDRMMHNLRLSGVLARLGGIVVGQFSDYEEDPRMPYTVYEGIRQMVEPYDYPVLFDFPAGHVVRNLPLLLNAPCRLSISAEGSILEQASGVF